MLTTPPQMRTVVVGLQGQMASIMEAIADIQRSLVKRKAAEAADVPAPTKKAKVAVPAGVPKDAAKDDGREDAVSKDAAAVIWSNDGHWPQAELNDKGARRGACGLRRGCGCGVLRLTAFHAPQAAWRTCCPRRAACSSGCTCGGRTAATRP